VQAMKGQEHGPDLEDLRQLMHEQVDAVFDQSAGPLGVEGAALQLGSQLLRAAEPLSIAMSVESCRLWR
jgi:hypothetical protein